MPSPSRRQQLQMALLSHDSIRPMLLASIGLFALSGLLQLFVRRCLSFLSFLLCGAYTKRLTTSPPHTHTCDLRSFPRSTSPYPFSSRSTTYPSPPTLEPSYAGVCLGPVLASHVPLPGFQPARDSASPRTHGIISKPGFSPLTWLQPSLRCNRSARHSHSSVPYW